MNLPAGVAAVWSRISADLDKLIFSAVAVVLGYTVYRLIAREIRSFREQGKLEEHVAYTLTRIVQWITIVVVLSAILTHFGITIAMISGVLTLLGGTIIGFAAVNTIGNAIAGLIVMTSRPFRVGDRIFFNGQFADVEAVELIYTKMMTLDNVLVSVPNQQLLQGEIDNYGKDEVVRRHVAVTPSFEYDSRDVERALLEAARRVRGVLEDPAPYVWITDFQSYAVEYILYAFIDQSQRLPQIDAELHRSVLETCKDHGVDNHHTSSGSTGAGVNWHPKVHLGGEGEAKCRNMHRSGHRRLVCRRGRRSTWGRRRRRSPRSQ